MEVWNGVVEHNAPIEGDNSIQFEPRQDLPIGFDPYNPPEIDPQDNPLGGSEDSENPY